MMEESRGERAPSRLIARQGLPPPTGCGRRIGRLASVRVLVLAPAAGFGGLCFRCSLEQEAEIGRDERVRRGDRVGVVDGPVVACEGDPAWVFAQPVLQLGPDLA